MSTLIRDFVNTKIVTLSSDESMSEARRLMRNFRNSLVAVIDSGATINLEPSELKGVIGYREILNCDDFSANVTDYMNADPRLIEINSELLRTVNSFIYEQQSYYLVKNGSYIVGYVGPEELIMSLQKVLQQDSSDRDWGLESLFTPLINRNSFFSS